MAQTINQLIQQVAAVNRARFANPFIPINLGSPQPLPLCALTLVCAFGDIHPTDLGYAANHVGSSGLYTIRALVRLVERETD